MRRSVTVTSLAASAVCGFVTGSTLLADEPVSASAGLVSPAGSHAAAGSVAGGQGAPGTPGVPAVPVATATPAPDRPSPDFGYAIGVTRSGGTDLLVFDRAVFHRGRSAAVAAAADGRTTEPGGWYVSNGRGPIRRIALAADLTVDAGPLLAGAGAAEVHGVTDFDRALERVVGPVPVVVEYDAAGRLRTLREIDLPGSA